MQTLEPTERWLSDSDSESSQNSRKAIAERFFRFMGKSAGELVQIASSIPPGQPQIYIEDGITKYLEQRDSQGVARSTISKEAGAIRGFFSANYIKLGKLPKKFRSMESTYESKGSYHVLTQVEVRDMIKSRSALEDKAVIAALAQTGQRIGILTALRFDMLQPLGKGWKLVHVPADIENRYGVQVNKVKISYRFGLHPESCTLFDKLEQERKTNDPFVFSMSKRNMQTIIDLAAKNSGIQKTIPRKLLDPDGKLLDYEWHVIHPHVFRRFWMDRMGEAGLENETVFDYLIGHKVKYGGTYNAGWFKDEKLLEIYKKAEPFLRVLPK